MSNSLLDWLAAIPNVYILLGRLVARAVVEEVDRRPDNRDRLGGGEHIVCSLLEAMAEAVAEIARLPEMAADAVAAAAFPRPRSLRERIMKAALRKAAHRVFAMAGTTQVEVLLRALRLGALLACPDHDDHPSLENNCAKPLAQEIGDDAAKEALERAVRDPERAKDLR